MEKTKNINIPIKRYRHTLKEVLKMLTPKQVHIFKAFLSQPYKEQTYKEIKGFSKEKSNSQIQKAIAQFLREEIITKRGIGNIILFKPNLENPKSLAYFSILTDEQLPRTAKQCLTTIKKELGNISFISMALFGSYSENKQKENSDLDIAVFVKSEEEKKRCKLELKSTELKCILPLDAHVFTKDEMLEMLKEQNENLGKQIARKHLAFHNPASFYSILDEGTRNGFRIAP